MTKFRGAIVGAGPAGFYAAEHLLRQTDPEITVDVFDRLPTPYGLVRAGVAPDHEKIKNVTRVFEKTASKDGFRFFGNVEFGRDISIDDVRSLYHFVIFATGAQVDRRLDIPGEDLYGSYSATEFVAWYNGHPDYRDRTFDLSRSAAVIVGVGNVAVDVARILCRTVAELKTTDIADYALEALAESNVRTVYMLGRRGPAQAAFTNPEVKELGEMEGADVSISPDEVALDELSRAELEANPDRLTAKKLEIMSEFSTRRQGEKPKQMILRFLVSPVEIIGSNGQVEAVRIVRNELYRADNGRIRPRPTDETELIEAGLVFRSVGYRGVALPGVPFRDDWGVIANEKGRVLDPSSGQPETGLYAAGWIKRGPTGVIGTNKADAVETVQCVVEDLAAGRTWSPVANADAVTQLLDERNVRYLTFEDWQAVEKVENERGKASGRPRVKCTTVDEMLAILDKS